VAQLAVVSAWLKCTAVQVAVEWQSSHALLVGMWFAGRAVIAREPVPPWHETQVRGVPAISPAT
jgi:hypothetical protein